MKERHKKMSFRKKEALRKRKLNIEGKEERKKELRKEKMVTKKEGERSHT